MDLVRITLAGIMALLVSMPFGVCEEDCQTGTCIQECCQQEAPACEDSCCAAPQEANVMACDCDCDCSHDGHTSHFESQDFLARSSEVSVPDAPESTDMAVHEFEDTYVFSLALSGDRLRAPPDPFVRSSRQIIHCVYRL